MSVIRNTYYVERNIIMASNVTTKQLPHRGPTIDCADSSVIQNSHNHHRQSTIILTIMCKTHIIQKTFKPVNKYTSKHNIRQEKNVLLKPAVNGQECHSLAVLHSLAAWTVNELGTLHKKKKKSRQPHTLSVLNNRFK